MAEVWQKKTTPRGTCTAARGGGGFCRIDWTVSGRVGLAGWGR